MSALQSAGDRRPQARLDLAGLAERAHDLIYRYRLRPTRGFDYVNPAATRITGYTPADHYADPDLGLKLIHPDDQPVLSALLDASPGPSTLPLHWIRKDGTTVWTEQRNTPVYDEAGELVAIEGIAREIDDPTHADGVGRPSRNEKGPRKRAFEVAGRYPYVAGNGSGPSVTPAWAQNR